MATSVQIGTVIDGKYRVLRHIGEGGMGTVYEGENVRIERRVAIKVLHDHVASSPDFAQRFEREARASARIGSPHVCDVLDLGDLPNGERFIVMEYLEGESLEDRITKARRLTPAQLAPIAFEILEGLGSMHQVGVIHRDLKPANVFLAKRQGNSRLETVKILDFGVAKILPRADEPSDMTSTGMMMGTPLYMSPEQARGARDVDGRTDLYAASVMFYRALTGEMPHSAANLHELLFKIVLEDPKPIRSIVPEVDDHFAAVIMKGLARDADHRYLSAREYQQAIAEWGNAQGRASLQFAVTMSSEPPPLRNLSGGFPASALRAQNTGPVLPKTGPPTPALAASVDPSRTSLSQGQQAPGTGPIPQQQQQGHRHPSGGTPIVWSEDAPEAVKRAYRELEAQKAAAAASAMNQLGPGGQQPGGASRTQAFDQQRPPQQNQHVVTPFNPGGAPTPTPMPPPKPQSQLGMKIGIGIGALVFISAAAVVGTKLATTRGGNGPVTGNTGTTTSASISTPDPSSTPTPSTSTTASENPPVADTGTTLAPSASTSVATTATATNTTTTAKWVPPPPTRTVATNTAPTVTPTVASVTPTTTPPTASTTPPTPTATTSGRKFRTNL